MAKDNISRYIILGMLSIKPMSGYDIKYCILRGVAHFWCISFGQIYPALRDFVREELVTFSTKRQEGRPEKKIYSLTEKGRSMLREWLLEPIDLNNGRYVNILTIKLYFGASIGKEAAIKHVTDVMEHENSKLETLLTAEKLMEQNAKKAAESNDSSYVYRKCTLNEGISMTKAQINWCRETISILKEEGGRL